MSWPRIWLLVLACIPGHLWGQSGKGLGFSLTSHVGGIIKHTEKLTFTPPPFSGGLEAALTYQTYGKHDWEAWQRYPVFSFRTAWFDLGTEQLGQAWGFYPAVQIPVTKWSSGQIDVHIGSGFAWLTNPYDRIDNPLQNAIGSHLNSIVALRLTGTQALGDHWDVTGGFSFTHFSNGQAQIPNYGINIVGGMLGLQYQPQRLQPSDYRTASRPNIPDHRWGWSLHTGLAFKEIFAFGGPRFPIYTGAIQALYQISRTQRLYAGLEVEYHRGLFVYNKLVWQYPHDPARHWAASRLMFAIGDEFLFGPWSLFIQAGTYLSSWSDQIPHPWYSKLALRYYLPDLPWTRARFYAGTYLKAHVITAEYISFGMGVAFD